MRPAIETRRRGRIAASAFLVFGLSLAPAEAETQRLSGLVRVTGQIANGVAVEKEITLDCPPGKVALSGGASLTGSVGGGQYLVESVPVFFPPTRWLIVARDLDGGGTVWGVRAAVWCANQPPGLEVVLDTSLVTSTPKTMTTSCPPGKATVGAGARIASNSYVTAALSQLRPYPRQRWEVSGTEPVPDSGDWALVTSVLCADVEPGLYVRNDQLHSGTWGYSESYCPSDYLALVGGGETKIQDGALSGNVPWETFAPLWIVWAGSPTDSPSSWGLDTSVLCFSALIFEDDFESSSTGSWSSAVY